MSITNIMLLIILIGFIAIAVYFATNFYRRNKKLEKKESVYQELSEVDVSAMYTDGLRDFSIDLKETYDKVCSEINKREETERECLRSYEEHQKTESLLAKIHKRNR